MYGQIITISREMGSGGRLIGKKVADILGYAFYDNEIISQTAEISGFSNDLILRSEDKIKNGILYNAAIGKGNGIGFLSENTREAMPFNTQIYLAQREAIQNLAKKGACVIVGRGADYVLKDEPDVLKCFIYSEFYKRVERAINEYGMDSNNAEKQIRQADKSREIYYNTVTDQKWGERGNYDIMINSGNIGIEAASNLIVSLVKRV